MRITFHRSSGRFCVRMTISRSQPDAHSPSPTLQDLATRALAGDRLAFDHAVHRLSPGLERLLDKRTNHDANQTQELCQQAWAEVWAAMVQRRYDPNKAAFSTFAYAVAHKVWLRHLRATGRAMPAEWAALVEGEESAEEALNHASNIDLVRACLRGNVGNLTEDDRWILRSAASGVTDRELAARLGIAPSSANARKQAAIAKLRTFLTKSDSTGKSTERGGTLRRQQGVKPTHRKEGEHG